MPPSNFSKHNRIDQLEARILMKKPFDIKLKDEEIRNANHPIHVQVKTMKNADILGFEELLELKRRYYTVKCISVSGTLYRVDIKVI